MMVWKTAIFQVAPPCAAHWCWTSSIWVASYTPAMSTFACCTTSASVPRIGPDVMTGEQMRIRFCADAMDRDIACTSFRLRPLQTEGRTRVPADRADAGAETAL